MVVGRIDIARRPDIADAIRETDAANIELVRMENQAFELVRFATVW